MSDQGMGVGGLAYDRKRRDWPSEVNVLLALVLIVLFFEAVGRLYVGDSFIFNTHPAEQCASVNAFSRFFSDCMFNTQRLTIIILQVSIIGIMAIGATQVIISGGIDLSSGSIVGATAMITMSFAQTALVNGNPNPTARWQDPAFFDLPLIVPIVVMLICGLVAGLINGLLVAYVRLQPFIATLGMMTFARGLSKWWTQGRPVSFPIESYKVIGSWLWPVIVYIGLAFVFHLVLTQTKYGRHCYAVGSNEEAARVSGVNIFGHKMLVYCIAAMLAAVAAFVLSSKNLTAQAGMGVQYELQAIAMAVIGGVSLAGGRGTIPGTVLGSLILGVVISGFTFINLDAYYQEMAMGVIICVAAAVDRWQQQRKALKR